jgi:hypothetical protein
MSMPSSIALCRVGPAHFQLCRKNSSGTLSVPGIRNLVRLLVAFEQFLFCNTSFHQLQVCLRYDDLSFGRVVLEVICGHRALASDVQAAR